MPKGHEGLAAVRRQKGRCDEDFPDFSLQGHRPNSRGELRRHEGLLTSLEYKAGACGTAVVPMYEHCVCVRPGEINRGQRAP